MDYRLKLAYEAVLNNKKKVENKEVIKPRSIKEAYSLVHEKLAFYSKEYPDDVEKSDNFQGFQNLGFVDKEYEVGTIQQIQSQNFKKLINQMFIEAGWTSTEGSSDINIRDFDYAFLNPIAQQLVASGLKFPDLEEIVKLHKNFNGYNSKVHSQIEGAQIFNLFQAINADYNGRLTNGVLDLLLTRSGKTTNDIAFGQGEILLTLLAGYKKPKRHGDLELPDGKKIELKISGGRICSPQDINNNFKQDAKQFLLKGKKNVESQSFKQKSSEADALSNEIYEFLIGDQEISGVLSEPFKNELLEILTSAQTPAEKIAQLKKFQSDHLESNSQNVDAALSYFVKNNLLGSEFDPTDKRKFRNVYSKLKSFLRNIVTTLNKTKKTIYETSLSTFLKNFFIEDYGLSVDEVAELYTLIVHFASEAERKHVKSRIVNFLSNENRFKNLQSDKSITEAIVFATQIYVYSRNHFNYLLIINKNTSQTLGINCSGEDNKDLFDHLLNVFTTNKKSITLDITSDFRGGSQLNIV